MVDRNADKQVDRVERPRDEGVIVPEIEKEKREKENQKKSPEELNKNLSIFVFFNYLIKTYKIFFYSKTASGKIFDIEHTINHLYSFKNSLKKLAKQDLSKSPLFAEDLSKKWIALNNDFEKIEITKRKRPDTLKKFFNMIEIIKYFPQRAIEKMMLVKSSQDLEHRLGYYLFEQTGKDWLPFPFIEILQKLHIDYQKNTKASTLWKWVVLIDEVIQDFEKDLLI